MEKCRNILAIDDSKSIIEYLRYKVEGVGKFKYFAAGSFEKAKELIESNEFFAAIVDLQLPDAKEAEALELTLSKGIASIVLTGTMNNELRDKIVSKPIVDYIQKDGPGDMEYAVNLLQKLDYFRDQKVLIVDDSESSCEYASQLFRELLFEPIKCKNPLDAVDILRQNPDIKIVTLDYKMPSLDGVELAKKIRRSFVGRDFAIFGISAINSDEVKYKFLKNGANTYMIKPIVREEFVLKVINAMDEIEQKERLASYIDKVDKYIITSMTDKNGIIKYVSKAFCEISGYEELELIGKSHSILRHPDTPSFIFNDMWNTITAKSSWSGEVKNKTKEGKPFWVKANIEPILDGSGDISGYQAIMTDITDKRLMEKMSITDELTSLYNRRYFNSQSLVKLEQARLEGLGFAFFIMDVDNFKKYNDTYGHQMGDEALKKIAVTLQKELFGIGGLAFRLGGEEFGGIFFCKSETSGFEVCNTIKNEIEALKIEHSKNNASNFITASFGLVFADFAKSNDKIEFETIYVKADEALYEAKDKGRNQVKLSAD